jgi:hypothetical protein
MSDVAIDKAPTEVFLDAESMAARYPVPITKHGIYRLVREGKLEGVVTRINRYVVFRLDRVEAWEAAGGFGLDDEPTKKGSEA